MVLSMTEPQSTPYTEVHELDVDWEDFFLVRKGGIVQFYLALASTVFYGVVIGFTGWIEGHYELKISCLFFMLFIVFNYTNRFAAVVLFSQVVFPIRFRGFSLAVTQAQGMAANITLGIGGLVLLALGIVSFFHSKKPILNRGGFIRMLLILFLLQSIAILPFVDDLRIASLRASMIAGMAGAFCLLSQTRINYEMIRRGMIAAGVVPASLFLLPGAGLLARGIFGENFRSELTALSGGGNSASAAVALLLVFSVGLVGSKYAGKLRRHAVWLVLLPSLLIVLILASRGAFLGVAAGLLGAFLLAKRKGAVVGAIIFGIVGIGIVFFFLLPNLFDVIGIRMRSFGLIDTEGRFLAYSAAIQIFRNNMFMGVGPGQFSFSDKSLGLQHAHNDLLNIAAEHGIFGLVLIVSAGFAMLTGILSKWGRSVGFTKAILFGTVIAFVVYMLEMQVYILYWEKSGLLMTGLVGLSFSMPMLPEDPYVTLEFSDYRIYDEVV